MNSLSAILGSKPVLVYNPVAGGGRSRAVYEELRKRVDPKLELSVVQTSEDGSWISGLERILDAVESPTTLVAIGGDGTLSQISKIMIDRENVTGFFIPGGRGNDFLRSLYGRYSDRFFDFAERVHWRHSLVDVARSTNGLFLNIASLIYGGEVVERVHEKRLGFLSSLGIVYQLEGGRGLLSTKETRVEILNAEKKLVYSGEAFGIFICNGKANGGGLYWAPNADVEDGLLDLIVFPRPGISTMLSSLNCVKKRKDPTFHHERFRSREFHLQFASPVAIELDGEFASRAASLGISCLHRALPLWIPSSPTA